MGQFSTLRSDLSFGYVKFSYKNMNGLSFDFHQQIYKEERICFIYVLK